MSEIEDIADMEFDDLHVLQHVDLGELDLVESHVDRTCQGNCCASSQLVRRGDAIPTIRGVRNLVWERTHAKGPLLLFLLKQN